jgi:hypothetical protein
MTVYSGNDGVAKVGASPAEVSKVTEFQIEATAEVDRTDGMGEEWTDSLVTKKNWSGSMTCKRNAADTNGQEAIVEVGTVIAAEFYPDSDATGRTKLSGDVIVTGVTEGANHEAANEISFSFLGKGALTRGTVGA